MKRSIAFIVSTSTLLMLLSLYACQKAFFSKDPGKKQVAVYLTDNPGLLKAVYVNILKVELKVEEENSGEHHDSLTQTSKWWPLEIKPGYYNILHFRNGLDTVLGRTTVPKGEISAIRLTLGEKNYVVVDSSKFPLNIRSEHRTVLIKIKEAEDVDDQNPNDFRLWIDFDISKSVVEIRPGEYYLRPVIRPFGEHKSGRIEGKVVPANLARPIVYAIAGKDTLSTIPEDENDDQGEFKIRGIRSATADLWIHCRNSEYKDTTITNLKIVPGEPTKVGVIFLHKK